MKKILALLVVSATMAAAHAAPVAKQQSLDSVNTLTKVKGKTGVLDFTQFDASLGTLLSVKLTLSSDLTGTYQFENGSTSSGANVNINSLNSLTVTSSAFSLPKLTNNYVNMVSVGVFDTVADYAGSSGRTIYVAGQHASESATFTEDAVLQAFTGSGLVHASITGKGNTTFNSTAGNLDSFALSGFNAYGSVVYTYMPAVPEPETYAMLLAGLGLMGAVMRKRKAA